MRRLVILAIAVSGALVVFAMALGACDDSCIDTGCVEEAGPDVKEAGKKDAAKDTGADAQSDVVDASDASDAVSDATDAAAD